MLRRFAIYFVVWFVGTFLATIGFIFFIALLGARRFELNEMLTGMYYIGPYVVVITTIFTSIAVGIIEFMIYYIGRKYKSINGE